MRKVRRKHVSLAMLAALGLLLKAERAESIAVCLLFAFPVFWLVLTSLRPGYAVEYDFAFPDQLRPTLEARLQPPHPRPRTVDRAAHQTEPARLPETIPLARRRVHSLPPLIPPPAQGLFHLFLQQLLQQAPDSLPGVGLQRLPRRP